MGIKIPEKLVFEVPDKKEIQFPPLIKNIIQKEIESLQNKQVIELVNEVEGQVISNVFVRGKKMDLIELFLTLENLINVLTKYISKWNP